MKSPPKQFRDEEAREHLEAFIRGEGALTTTTKSA
jgi:hypothetical protein